ncbi:MAG: hypothetical protein FWC50_03525 [Planctomycetaceae bacterium]|nr:hypothetical protein [Planctomycetaceae bacterium]
MKTLKIHSELHTLLPALSDAEYKGLEADILEHGCLSPLVVWNDTIVDGHNRYSICQDHELPFDTVELEFDSLDDAKLWAWQHQEHRRNLTPFQRTEIAGRFKTALATKAKARMSAGGSKKCNQESNEGMSTLSYLDDEKKSTTVRGELAKIAGVSEGTMAKAEYLHEHADDETKERLRSGETTINKEYTRLRIAGKDEIPDFDPEPLTPTFPNPTDTFQESVTLEHILLHDPETLISCLFSLFDAEYRERLIVDLLAKIEEEDGINAVERIVTQVCNQFPMTR